MFRKKKAQLDTLIDYFVDNWLMYFPSHRIRRWIVKNRIASLGNDTWFLMGVKIRNGDRISIGNNCAINKDVLFDGRGGDIFIGDNVDISQETNIWTLQHDPQDDNHNTVGADVKIENYVWIASRVTILPGVNIGKGAVIGAGSIVTKDVPSMKIVAGNPARIIADRKSKLNYKINYRPKFK